MPDFNDLEDTPITQNELDALAEIEGDAAEAWAEEPPESKAIREALERVNQVGPGPFFSLAPLTDIEDVRTIKERHGEPIDTGIEMASYSETSDKFTPEESIKLRGITVFSARTSGGKTMALTSMAAYLTTIAEEKTFGTPPAFAVFFSLEEPADAIYTRLLGNFAEFRAQQEERESTAAAPIRPDGADINKYLARTPIPDRPNGTTGAKVESTIEQRAAEMKERIQIFSSDSINTTARAYIGREAPFNIAALSVICSAIKALKERYEAEGKRPMFFIDYAQFITDDTERTSAIYKSLQNIMHKLQAEAQNGALIFMAAQSNRENAKETHGEKFKEFYNAMAEQMRESADIEQTAETIFYTVIRDDGDAPRLLMRTLKSRGGRKELYTAHPIIWSTRTVDFSRAEAPKLTPKKAQGTQKEAQPETGAASASTGKNIFSSAKKRRSNAR